MKKSSGIAFDSSSRIKAERSATSGLTSDTCEATILTTIGRFAFSSRDCLLSRQFAEQFRQHLLSTRAELNEFHSHPTWSTNRLDLADGSEGGVTHLHQNLSARPTFERRNRLNAASVQAQVSDLAREIDSVRREA